MLFISQIIYTQNHKTNNNKKKINNDHKIVLHSIHPFTPVINECMKLSLLVLCNIKDN